MLCRTVDQHRHLYTMSSCPGNCASNCNFLYSHECDPVTFKIHISTFFSFSFLCGYNGFLCASLHCLNMACYIGRGQTHINSSHSKQHLKLIACSSSPPSCCMHLTRYHWYVDIKLQGYSTVVWFQGNSANLKLSYHA